LKWIIFFLRGEDGEKVFPKEACGWNFENTYSQTRGVRHTHISGKKLKRKLLEL
jgi:hypothetical protein